MRTQSLFLLLLPFLLAACSRKPALSETEMPVVAPDTTFMDTVFVAAEKPTTLKTAEEYQLPTYNPSQTREHDLLHTRLDIRFDWNQQHVLGKAWLTMHPWFYPTDTVRLDAKNFDVHRVSFDQPTGKVLRWKYDGQILTVALPRVYTKDEEFTLYIDYTAKPAARENFGGSAAITSDQGLFFINHDGSQPNKPMQIWTQGETENNSRWFPTFDQPNERCTQEISLTVDNRFVTLSNGTLIRSENPTDSTRTDTWKQDQPHAPYLFMVAVGEFAVVKDEWRGKPVHYYVEPEYEPDARAIFAHTPEMLSFFSDRLGLPYPWDKYSQIVVRDFVSGAMENTTAVIFGDFVQRHRRELIDNNNDRIVAHEMFHHWFGDYVTCESWANLTMNEGFANYSEYLWFEHFYGRDYADYHRRDEMRGYLSQAADDPHDLIYYDYEDKEATFDAHSYNKGGLVLHMLRDYVGDEAFWAALNLYLTRHTYTPVEADELRLAFEEVCGEDLNWFFNQWYFSSGHPILDIQYDYDETARQLVMTVEQTQDPDRFPPIFVLPVKVDLFFENGRAPLREEIWVNQRKQTFRFDAYQPPLLVNFDADKVLLAERTENKTFEQYLTQFYNCTNFLDQWEALQELADSESSSAQQMRRDALKNDFWGIREWACTEVNPQDGGIRAVLEDLAQNDPHSDVRSSALDALVASGKTRYLPLLENRIQQDSAYNVIGVALEGLAELEMSRALPVAEQLSQDPAGPLLYNIATVFAQSGQPEYLSFFEQNFSQVNGFGAIEFMATYGEMVRSTNDPDLLLASMKKLEALATDMGESGWRRYAATKTIADTRDGLPENAEEPDNLREQLNQMIANIKEKEESDQLKRFYQSF